MELFGLFSIFFILDDDNKWNLFLSGIMIGLSAMSKQSGIVYLPIIFLIILSREPHQYQLAIKKIAFPIIGLGFISAIITVFLLRYNILKEFIYWTIIRNISLAPATFSDKISVFLMTVINDNYLLYFLVFCSILSTIIYYKYMKKSNLITIIICVFWICAFILLYSFTPQIQTHYFYSLIAPLSIIAAIFLERIVINKKILFACLLLFIALYCINYAVQIDNFSHNIVSSATGVDLKDQKQISSDIRNLTSPNEKVLILFSSPEYYFLSNRESSTPYPQFNDNYISNNEKPGIINNLILQESQKIILIRNNDWGYFNISTAGFNKNYSLYKSYSNSDVEFYILKNNMTE